MTILTRENETTNNDLLFLYKGTGYTVSAILYRGDNFCDFLFYFAYTFPSEKGSVLKGKLLFPLGTNSFL